MRRVLFFLTTITLFCHAVQGQSTYTVIPIVPGGSLYALSDSGHVVGRAGFGSFYVWKDGEIEYINSPAGADMWSHDVNALGQVTGYYYVSAGGPRRAFLWQDGVFTGLGTYGGYTNTFGWVINNAGVIAGDATGPAPAWGAFTWEEGVFTPTQGGTPFTPMGINDSSHLVGANGREGYLYRNGQLINLGDLPADSVTDPLAVNSSDVVVGRCGSSFRKAFRWQEGTMTPLNTVNSNLSEAWDINDSGDVVGLIQMVAGQSVYHAYLWKDGIPIDLNSRIDPAEGWTLTMALGINNRGEIVASATRNGQTHTVLLTNRPTVIRPASGERWIVGEPDTIRWKSDVPRNYEIRFSSDGGSNFSLITTVAKTESIYVWHPPDSLSTSSECVIKLTDALDSTVSLQSAEFTLRAYDLVRPFPDSTLEVFRPVSHGWAFDNNSTATIWPQSWWDTRFDYSAGTDPYTGEVYPAGIFQQCQSIEGVLSCPADSDFVDWVSWAGTFGVDACYSRSIFSGNPNGYRHHATSLWKRSAVPYNGACYGLAVSALLAFHYSDWLHANYSLPPFDALLTVPMDANVRQLITHFYSYQFGMDQWNYDQAGEDKSPVQTLHELKTKLLTDDPADDCILNMRNQGGSGGHTVLPYRVESDPGNPALVRIYVYDSNNPSHNDVYVVVDTSANTWTPIPDLGWTGGGRGLFLDLSIGNFQSRPLLRELPSAFPKAEAPDDAGPALYVLTDPGTEALIVSPLGDTVGFVQDRVIDNSSNVHALIPKTGTAHPPIGYRLSDGTYDLLLTDFSGPTSNLTVLYPDAIYEYQRDAANPMEMDRLSVAGGLGIGNGDGVAMNVHLRAVTVEDSTEVRFDLLNFALLLGDSLFMQKLDSVSVKIENHGSARTFDLSIERISNLEQQQFHHAAVSLTANSTGQIVVDEDSLQAVEVLVDQGHDGTIDDTVTVANQLTGVRDEIRPTRPEAFTLGPNYPNPFNATTIIEYGLPAAAHATLRVYDALGREVATLVDAYQAAGFRQARWDATGAPSGVYYVRITAGAFTATEELLLMR